MIKKKDSLKAKVSNLSKETNNKYIKLIENDNSLKELWNSYISNYEYAKDISYNDTISAIKTINDVL